MSENSRKKESKLNKKSRSLRVKWIVGKNQMLGEIHKPGTAYLFVWNLLLCVYAVIFSCFITTFSLCNCTLQTLLFISVSSHFPVSKPTFIKHRWPVLCSIISLALLPSIFVPTLFLFFISRCLTKKASWHSIWLDWGEHGKPAIDSSESSCTF